MTLTIDHLAGFTAGLAVAVFVFWRVNRARESFHRRLVAAQNLSALAKHLTDLEAGRKQVNIAQVREVIAVLGRHLRLLPPPQADALAAAIRERAGMAGRHGVISPITHSLEAGPDVRRDQ